MATLHACVLALIWRFSPARLKYLYFVYVFHGARETYSRNVCEMPRTPVVRSHLLDFGEARDEATQYWANEREILLWKLASIHFRFALRLSQSQNRPHVTHANHGCQLRGHVR